MCSRPLPPTSWETLFCTYRCLYIITPICGRRNVRILLRVIYCKYKFRVPQITRIEYLHGRKLIHRDIKPENLAIGRPQTHKESTENTIYLIDMGIAKSYEDPATGTHVPFSRQAGVFGTYQFMSVNSHANIGPYKI